MDYKTCTIDELVEHILSISRERVRQKLSLAKQRGETEVVAKIELAKEIVRDQRHSLKGTKIAGVGTSSTLAMQKYPKTLYAVWHAMLQRCYKEYPTKPISYVQVTVDDEFLNFENYARWIVGQIGYGVEGFHLDKDLLSGDSKRYSKETCVFLPHEINGAISDKSTDNGLPRGVVAHKNGSFHVKHRNKHLGTFSTAKEASDAYVKSKKSHLRDLAEKWKDQIAPAAYDALLNYKVLA